MTQIIKYYIIEGFIVIGAILASLLWPSHLTISESCNIAALLLGPAIAIRLAKYLEDVREKRHRKWDIFQRLMLARQDPISPAFVISFNRVEIEFHDENNVMEAWNKLEGAFNELPPNTDEGSKKYNRDLHDLRIRLISEVGISLGINLDSLKLHKGGYKPQGWQAREDDEEKRLRLMTDVLSGKQPIKVSIEPNQPENASYGRGLAPPQDS